MEPLDAQFASSTVEDAETFPDDHTVNSENGAPPKESEDIESIRLKNRLAARKFREKRQKMLTKLEEANDSLRAKVYELTKVAIAFQVENTILEKELQFFQATMKTFMRLADA